MSFLDQFFKGYEAILNAGQLLLARAKINLVAPLVATDDPANKWTSVAISPASSTAAGSLSGADYAKIQALAPGAFLPLAPVARADEGPATGDIIAPIAFASKDGPSLVSVVVGRALGPLTPDATNNRTLNIYDVSATGVRSASLYSITTTAGGTGAWASGATIFTWTANYTLAANHALLAIWSSNVGGVIFPGMAFRVT